MKNVERFSFLKHIDGEKFDLGEFILLKIEFKNFSEIKIVTTIM